MLIIESNMALIYFYDASEIDVSQITEGLSGTDHHWEFVKDSINAENLDPETEVISVFVTSVVTREIITRLPKLKLIACRSTGFNNIDLAAATEHGITVVNVPTYGEATVAEYAFTLLLALARKLPQSLDFVGRDNDVRALIGWDLNGKTIGVVGTGHIGQHTIKIAKGFEMRVVAYDPYPNEKAAKELGFEYVSLDELMSTSDVISVHAPYLPSNNHLINSEKLSLMKPTAVIINTARGELVDTQALVEALRNKLIAGAALDVLEGEKLMDLNEEVALLRRHTLAPNALNHSMAIMALNKMDNVILAPHNAFNTLEAVGRINGTTCQNIIRFWYGETPNKVEPGKPKMGKLLITRHAESEWNASGKWTGTTDVHLSQKGFREAAMLGIALAETGIKIDKAYCSNLIRTLETLEGILDSAQQFNVDAERSGAIDERDYGDYTGKNKWEVQKLVGESEFNLIRRGWDHSVPNGETLKMVYERVVPFYEDTVLPLLKSGKNVMLVGHGNSMRSLIKYLENLDDDAVESLEMLFGRIVIYDLDDDGKMNSKIEKQIDSPVPKA